MEEVISAWGIRGQNFGCFYSMGNINVTGSYVAVTSSQNISAPVSAGESTCGDFMDSLSVIPTHGVLGKS